MSGTPSITKKEKKKSKKQRRAFSICFLRYLEARFYITRKPMFADFKNAIFHWIKFSIFHKLVIYTTSLEIFKNENRRNPGV